MWQRTGAGIYIALVRGVVLVQAAAMITLVAAVLLRTFGNLQEGDLQRASALALVAIVGGMGLLAVHILIFHAVAAGKESRRAERVRSWMEWWLATTPAPVAEPLPREAIDAFLDLRETLPADRSWRLVQVARERGLEELLLQRLGARSKGRRLEGLQDLARARLPQALPALVRTLRDGDSLERRHALRAAARTLARCPKADREAATAAFVPALQGVDLPAELVAESILLLEELAGAVIERLLADAGTPPAVVRGVLQAAGRPTFSRLAGRVVPLISDPDGELRAAALRCLSGMGRVPADAVDAVVDRLEDPAAFVRVHAVRAASTVVHERITGRLWDCLGDPSWWVRRAAAEVLAERGEEGRRALERAAHSHPDRFARDIASQALVAESRVAA